MRGGRGAPVAGKHSKQLASWQPTLKVAVVRRDNSAPRRESKLQPQVRLPLRSMYGGTGEWPKETGHGDKKYPWSNTGLVP